jgi:CheY-like chemotaxis protein
MTVRTRVLVVDDEEMMRELVGTMLEMEGYEVAMADGGQSALDAIAARRPDLVLLDLNMPKMTGWQVIDRLKNHENPPPIIAMSGMGMKEPPGLNAVRRFVYGYLPKPFLHEQLAKTLGRALETARTVHVEAAEVAGEPRKDLRRNLLVAATLLSPEGLPAALGQILNLSPAGAQIDLGAALNPGMAVTLIFDIPGGHGPFRVTGRVEWMKDGKVGLAFVDVPDDEYKRLEDLLATS